MAQDTTTETGNVEQTNANGFKLNGKWLNYSQYGYHGSKYEPQSPTPSVGQHVVVQLKQDKFIHALSMGTQQPAAQAAPLPTPVPTTNAQAVQDAEVSRLKVETQAMVNHEQLLLKYTIETRRDLFKTLAVAQPGLFTLDNNETAIEIVRNLEQFVLEDLKAMAPVETDEDVTADDLLEEV
jgi:hypothetical protein